MSESDPTAMPTSPPGSLPPPSWRGRQKPVNAEPSPAWRSAPSERPTQRVALMQLRRATATVLLFIVAAALFGILVRDLVFYPRMAPFVALSVTRYNYPLSPNSWAREDLEQLLSDDAGLDNKTLTVRDLSLDLRDRDNARTALAASLKQTRDDALHSGVLMVYVSCHGAVDDDGEIRLLLPDAVPTDSHTWWPLQDVFAAIAAQKLPEKTLKLVILDCTRELIDWRSGIVCNHVASRLEAAVDAARIPNLVVLNSTSPGEFAWDCRDMHGSVFAQYLRIGLAGAADQSMGDHNRQVSLHELHRYVERSVDAWAWTHRRSRQRPILVPRSAPDHLLTWSLGPSELKAIVAQANTLATPVPVMSVSSLSRMWFEFDELRNSRLLRSDPDDVAEIEQRFLWLEAAAVAGSQYAEPALDMQRSLEETLASLQQRASFAVASVNSQSAASELGMSQGLRNSQLDSVPLSRHFQTLTESTADRVINELNQIASAPSLPNIRSALQRLETEVGVDQLSEVQFLKLLAQYLPALGTDTAKQLPALIHLQIRAEKIAAPVDERQLPWLRPLLLAADHERRAALDACFASVDTQVSLDAANVRYAAAERLVADLSRALQLRDRVQAELPYLAQWVSRPTWPATQQAVQAALVRDTLPQLFDAVQQLHVALSHPPADADFATLIEVSPFQSEFDETSKHYEVLRSLLDDEYDRLVNPAHAGIDQAPAMRDLLQLPLLSRKDSSSGLAPFAQRAALQQLALQMSTDLQGRYPPFAPLTAMELPPTAAPDGELIVRQWVPSPLVGLLDAVSRANNMIADAGSTPTTLTNVDSLTEIGRAVRQRLAAIPDRLNQLHRQSLVTLQNPRSRLDDAEHLLRASAALLSTRASADPVDELRLIDLQQMFLLAAARRLEDFWGSAQPQQKPFFETAARSDLANARELFEPGAFVLKQLGQLREQLDARSSAARDGLAVSTTDVLLLDALPQINVPLGVQVSEGTGEEAFPAGTAAVWIRPVDTPVATALETLTLPFQAKQGAATQQQLTFQLAPADIDHTQPRWDAIVAYRGNEYRSGFLAHLPAGSVTDFRPASPKDATIVISGGPVKNESVVFILDCSHSMSQPASAEGPGDPPSRMDAASAALHSMLAQLSKRQDIRVGVEFFGHRIGWNTKQAGQLLPQLSYKRPIPAGLQPYEDVEVVLPVGRFDASWEESITSLTKTVKPWGESPIYLAIIRAAELFASQATDEARTIVVITDGVNYQFNPSPEARKQLQDALAALHGKQIAVHIVGFGIGQEDSQTANKEFGTLATQTSGSYVPVNRASELVDSLETILSVRKFTVTPAGGEPQSSQVGRPVAIQGPFSSAKPLVATLGTAQLNVEVQGGEALDFTATHDGRALKSARYERNLAQFVPLTPTQGSPSLQLGIHHPVRRSDGVLFEFSVQDPRQGFVRRPQGMWLTITPESNGFNSSQPYVFYDAEYVAQTPTPVVQWLATGWPALQSKARVEVWIRDDLPPPLQQVAFGDNTATAVRDGLTISLPSLPNVRVDVRVRPGDQDRIDVIERHPAGSTTDDLLHVSLQTDRQVARVVRRFDFAQQVAIHMFLLAHDDRALEDRLRGTSVQIRTHRSFAAGAYQLTQPTVVDIAANDGLIDLTPPPKAP